MTWGELEARTTALGSGIEHDLGVAPGSHVTVIARNRHEFVEAMVGAMRAGMTTIPVKASWTTEEIGYLLDDSGASLVITDLDTGREAARERGLALLDLGTAEDPESFEDWLAAQSSAPLPYHRNGSRMAYTSGTTGRPKGVVRKARGDRPWCEAFAASTWLNEAMNLDASGPHLDVSALYHGAPLGCLLSLLAAGVECRILSKWDPELALQELQRGVVSTVMVPTHFRQLLALPDDVRAAFHAPALRSVVHGGEPCPRSLKLAMIEWLGPIIHEYYGTSEGGTTTVRAEDWLERPGTVGRPITGMQVVVLDEHGNDVGANVEGTIYFRHTSGQFFSYRNAPEKTSSAHGPDGAFTVGDVGFLDDDGFLFISGRKADVIVSSGVNVYPAEIEDVLTALPEVAEVAVVGGPDDRRGERPVAFVHFVDDVDPEQALAAVEAAAGEQLAGYKQPREWHVRAELPRDGTGKLLRHVLRGELWEGRDDVFANTSATFVSVTESEHEFLALEVADGSTHGTSVLCTRLMSMRDVFFGGAATALACSMMEHVSQRPMVWCSVQMVSTAATGDRLVVEVDEVRAGRSVSQLRVVGTVDGHEVFFGFGAAGDGAPGAGATLVSMPEVAAPHDCPPVDWSFYPEPEQTYIAAIEMRETSAQPPEGAADGTLLRWARIPALPVWNATKLAFIADTATMGIAQTLGGVSGLSRRGSSLDNTTRFGPRYDDEWVLVATASETRHHGFCHGSVHIWAEDGALLALGSQTFAFRPPRG